ncbi:1865_t:CDS:1, partial [Scutellospora calospora]
MITTSRYSIVNCESDEFDLNENYSSKRRHNLRSTLRKRSKKRLTNDQLIQSRQENINVTTKNQVINNGINLGQNSV